MVEEEVVVVIAVLISSCFGLLSAVPYLTISPNLYIFRTSRPLISYVATG